MKLIIILFVFASGCVFAASPVGLLPEGRIGSVVEVSERNPFGANAPKSEVVVSTDNEEARLRGLLAVMPVAGVTRSDDGLKVLLGSYVIEEGRPIARLLPNQREKLSVVSIDEDRMVIGFVEKDGQVAGRKVIIPLNLAPSVMYKIGRKTTPGRGSGFDGVITKDELTNQ